MLYDEPFRIIGEVSSLRASEYCRRHGLQFVQSTGLLDAALTPSWNKILMVKRVLDTADWVLWLDADAFIVDMDHDLRSGLGCRTGKDCLVSVDDNGLCAGVFALRNSAWSRQLLDTVLFLGPMKEAHAVRLEGRYNHEQSTLKLVRRSFSGVDDRFANWPQTVVSNPGTRPRPPRPFIHHYWSSMGNSDMVSIRDSMLAQL